MSSSLSSSSSSSWILTRIKLKNNKKNIENLKKNSSFCWWCFQKKKNLKIFQISNFFLFPELGNGLRNSCFTRSILISISFHSLVFSLKIFFQMKRTSFINLRNNLTFINYNTKKWMLNEWKLFYWLCMCRLVPWLSFVCHGLCLTRNFLHAKFEYSYPQNESHIFCSNSFIIKINQKRIMKEWNEWQPHSLSCNYNSDYIPCMCRREN